MLATALCFMFIKINGRGVPLSIHLAKVGGGRCSRRCMNKCLLIISPQVLRAHRMGKKNPHTPEKAAVVRLITLAGTAFVVYFNKCDGSVSLFSCSLFGPSYTIFYRWVGLKRALISQEAGARTLLLPLCKPFVVSCKYFMKRRRLNH